MKRGREGTTKKPTETQSPGRERESEQVDGDGRDGIEKMTMKEEEERPPEQQQPATGRPHSHWTNGSPELLSFPGQLPSLQLDSDPDAL